MAVGMLALSSPSHASSPTPVDASLEELTPTSEQVIAYLLKNGPPNPERRFLGLPAVDREGLRFGAFENIECTEQSRYQGRPYWRCFYTMTAFTRAGTKLTSRGWEILGHDDKGALQPIMLRVVPTPPAGAAPSNNSQPPGSDASHKNEVRSPSSNAPDFCSTATNPSQCKISLEESWELKDKLRACLYQAGEKLGQNSAAIREKYMDFARSCSAERAQCLAARVKAWIDRSPNSGDWPSSPNSWTITIENASKYCDETFDVARRTIGPAFRQY